jgi:hypothetical protein
VSSVTAAELIKPTPRAFARTRLSSVQLTPGSKGPLGEPLVPVLLTKPAGGVISTR